MIRRGCGRGHHTTVNANALDLRFLVIMQQIQNLSVRLYQYLAAQQEGGPAAAPFASSKPAPLAPVPSPAPVPTAPQVAPVPTTPQVALIAPPAENRLLRGLVEQFLKLHPQRFFWHGQP